MINMNIPFGKDNFIEVKKIVQPCYNERISIPDNAKIVIRSKMNHDSLKYLSKINGDYLNAHEFKFSDKLKSLFSNVYQDKGDYIVYFVCENSLDGKINFEIPDSIYNGLINYKIQVLEAKDLINSINITNGDYTEKQMIEFINNKINNYLEKLVSLIISKNKGINIKAHKNEFINTINDEINKNVAMQIGISFQAIDIDVKLK